MKRSGNAVICLSALLLGAPGDLRAQPGGIDFRNFPGQSTVIGTGAQNLRVFPENRERTVYQLTIDYTYDSSGGSTRAEIVPVIGKRNQEGVSGWFGCNPVTIGPGRGTVTLRVTFFNDEPGVPAAFTSDQVQILFFNPAGTAVLSSVPFLQTIKWGSGDTRTTAKSQIKDDRAARRRASEEAKGQEKARQRAQTESKKSKAAEEKSRAAVLALDGAHTRTLTEAHRLAEEMQRLQMKHLAKEKKREEEQQKAAAEAERLRKEQSQAKNTSNAKALQEDRKRLEAEVRRLEEERKKSEAALIAEQKALNDAKARAEAEEQRVAEQKRRAEEELQIRTKAREEAEALQEKAIAQAKQQSDAATNTGDIVRTNPPVSFSLANLKTKVTRIDVVRRTLDRKSMTIGVEYELDRADGLSEPMLGVELFRRGEPESSQRFQSAPAEIGKSRLNTVLLPVTFQPPEGWGDSRGFSTDHILVYLMEKTTARRHNLFAEEIPLTWGVRPPLAGR